MQKFIINVAGISFFKVANIFIGELNSHEIKMWATSEGITIQLIRKDTKQYVKPDIFDRSFNKIEAVRVIHKLKELGY